MRAFLLAIAWLLISVACASPVRAQFEGADDATESPAGGPELGDARTQQFRVGVIVSAGSGPCRGLVATLPVPNEWPEQTVRVVEEEVSPLAEPIDYRIVGGTVKQLIVSIPNLPAGEEATVAVTFEVERHSLVEPTATDGLHIPDTKDLPRDLKTFLGPSPYIESTNAKIKTLAKEVGGELEGWVRVEALFDWVRDNIEPSTEAIPLKGAVKALKDKQGDCEDLGSLFIALCRASGVPARTVWVPGHCYPEFYLVDDTGAGYWFPCEPHGSRAFGGNPDQRPILQKGDNFRTPERPRDRQRYVAEFLTGAGGKPSVRWIMELDGQSLKR
jgi:transglutaminase-like putative cysteine protease